MRIFIDLTVTDKRERWNQTAVIVIATLEAAGVTLTSKLPRITMVVYLPYHLYVVTCYQGKFINFGQSKVTGKTRFYFSMKVELALSVNRVDFEW